MCDVGKELNNAANSVSNALGTDGSKNGLLNDPQSLALVAAGTGVYLAGGFDALAAGSVADSTTAAAAAAPNAVAAAGVSAAPAVAVADAATTATASSAFDWGAIGSGALSVGKAVLPTLPALLASRGGAQPGANASRYQVNGYTVPQSINASTYPAGNGYMPQMGAGLDSTALLLLAGIALIAFKAKG